MKSLSATGKKWLAGTILVLLAVGVTLLATFAGLDGRGPARLVEKYVTSINERDFASFCECFMPSDQPAVQSLAEAAGGEEAFFEQNYSGTFNPENPYQDFGEDVVVSISDSETEAQKITDGKYNGVDVAAMEISAVSTVTCTMTTKGTLSESSERVEAVCVKIEGKWYLLTMASLPDENISPTDVG